MLKRSGFAKKSYNEVLLAKQAKDLAKSQISTTKRVKKVKKQTITKLKKKLWEEIKRIVRKTFISDDGQYRCFTCGKLIENMSSVHTAHFIPSASCGAYLRYDFRNLRICCYFCNVNLGGNGAMYYKRLVETEGQEYVDKLFQDKNISIKADAQWYENKIEECKKM